MAGRTIFAHAFARFERHKRRRSEGEQMETFVRDQLIHRGATFRHTVSLVGFSTRKSRPDNILPHFRRQGLLHHGLEVSLPRLTRASRRSVVAR